MVSLELRVITVTPYVHENIHPREGQQRGYNITGGAITGRAAKAVARLHIKRNPREETHTRARVCLLHGARVVCALVKKLSLSPSLYTYRENGSQKSCYAAFVDPAVAARVKRSVCTSYRH